MLCDYKDVFGKPNEGVHKYRIFGVAAIDVIATLVFAWWLSLVFKTIGFAYIAIGAFSLGIFMHRVFCVRTTVDKLIFE
jgi:hypothetical protein